MQLYADYLVKVLHFMRANNPSDVAAKSLRYRNFLHLCGQIFFSPRQHSVVSQSLLVSCSVQRSQMCTSADLISAHECLLLYLAQKDLAKKKKIFKKKGLRAQKRDGTPSCPKGSRVCVCVCVNMNVPYQGSWCGSGFHTLMPLNEPSKKTLS